MSLNRILKNKMVTIIVGGGSHQDSIGVYVDEHSTWISDAELSDLIPIVADWSGVTTFTYYQGKTIMVKNDITYQNESPFENPEQFLKRIGVL